MNHILEFQPAARIEFDEAADWCEDQRPGLRREFVYAVDSALAAILKNPLAFPIVHGSHIRRALVHHFPFAIIYEAENDVIVVYSIFHTKRNPMIWRGRI